MNDEEKINGISVRLLKKWNLNEDEICRNIN